MLLLALTGSAAAFFNRRRTAPAASVRWDVPSLATAYAGIISPLAAFSVASAVFLAGLTRSTQTRAFEQVMALFVFAFIILMGTSLMFATLRGGIAMGESSLEFSVARRVMYVLCNFAFFLGLNVSWLGLQPFLTALDLTQLSRVLSWVLLFSILSGAARQGAWCHTLLGASRHAPYTLTAVAALAACAYRLGLVPLLRGLWPAAATLTLCLIVFAFAALVFAVETMMIRLQGDSRAQTRLARIGPAVLPSYISAAVTALLLLWFSLVMGPA